MVGTCFAYAHRANVSFSVFRQELDGKWLKVVGRCMEVVTSGLAFVVVLTLPDWGARGSGRYGSVRNL